MTHIVEGFKTKKALKEAVAAGANPYISNPAYGMFPGQWQGFLKELPTGTGVMATNHPKRSWFASIKNVGGKVVIE